MATIDQKQIQEVIAMLKKLEYGSLLITVHDGRITQVDQTVKNRFGSKNKVG